MFLCSRRGTGTYCREYIEWSDVWLTGANQTDKPHVLLLGNSITRGYHPKVEKLLEGKAT